jgi:signal transduction histidine kinase
MNRLWRKFTLYSTLPEMQPFWFFITLVVGVFLIDFFYLPSVWIWVSIGLFVVLGATIFFTNLRFARSSLQVKVERNLLHSVVSNLRDGIIAYDQDFRVILFNPAAEVIFNVRKGDIIGKTISTGMAEDARMRLLVQTIFTSLAPVVVTRSEPGSAVQMYDMFFENPSMQLRVVSARIVDPAGKLLGFMKIVHDRSREVAILKSKTEFISVTARELQAPLSAVSAAFETLAKESLPEGAKQSVAEGYGASAKAFKLVKDLLDASQIEEGRFGYKFEQVEVVSFVEKILASASASAAEYKVGVYFERPKESEITLSADPSKLGAALSNLLENAIRYNVTNGQVVVHIEKLKDAPYVLFAVKDTGIGIPPEDMKKLFSKFFRAGNASSLDAGGTGLGLYIVKNIVTRHGGQIWAESQLKRGTTFYFTIPTDPKLIPPKEIGEL